MKIAVYAGSFDPWSTGHQFVLNAALKVFDSVHILVAINPNKGKGLDSEKRAQAIAHSINPFTLWQNTESPFCIGNKITISSTSGLVVSYAKKHSASHLIRGLRSTSDFEAEFGLYFSNLAINSKIQTWCVLCPPDLLHCSSTFIRNVVGKSEVDFIGASFVTQALLLEQNTFVAHLLDIINLSIDGNTQHNYQTNKTISLQKLFLFLYQNNFLNNDEINKRTRNFLDIITNKKSDIKNIIFPNYTVSSFEKNWGWAALIYSLYFESNINISAWINNINVIKNALQSADINLFIESDVLSIIKEMLNGIN